MKRNKENKARQRIINTYHLDKQGQRELDEQFECNNIKYTEWVKPSARAWTLLPIYVESNLRRSGTKIESVIYCGQIIK